MCCLFISSDLISSPLFAPSLLVATQTRGHWVSFSPPFPLGYVSCVLIARIFQHFSSLHDSCQITPTQPTKSPSASGFFIFLQLKSNAHHGKFELGYQCCLLLKWPLDYRGDIFMYNIKLLIYLVSGSNLSWFVWAGGIWLVLRSGSELNCI